MTQAHQNPEMRKAFLTGLVSGGMIGFGVGIIFMLLFVHA